MIRLPALRMAWLLLSGPLVLACVYDGTGSSAGAGEVTTEAATTVMIASPATSTSDASTSAVPTSSGAPEPETGTTTGAVEPATTTSTSTTTSTTTGGTTDDGEQALGFESDIAPIFADYCTCHGDGSPSPDLGIGRAYDNIVRESADDVDMELVEPGWPNHSYLWHKIAGTHEEVGGEGKRMPPNDQLLDTDMDLIEAWIAQGAAP